MNKIQTTEVEVGNTVKGNLVGGFHKVARIATRSNVLRNTSTEYSFYNEAGEEFFIGRANSKATVQA